MLVAKQYNLIYAHTPFNSLDHNKGKENFFEDAFNLSKNEVNIKSLDDDNLEIKYIKHPFEIKDKDNVLYITQSCHQYADKYPDKYLNVVDEFKNKFFDNFKSQYVNYNDNKNLNIGLHIRRGDVSKNKNEIKFTNNSYYINIVNNILKLVDNLGIDVNIHIYSQGLIEDFKEFESYNVFYHLDECLLTTFYNLIESDILVMSKSSLSYCAGLLNENIIIYQEFWHKPLSNWNIVKFRDGDLFFDKSSFKNQIIKLLEKNKIVNAI